MDGHVVFPILMDLAVSIFLRYEQAQLTLTILCVGDLVSKMKIENSGEQYLTIFGCYEVSANVFRSLAPSAKSGGGEVKS